MDVDDAIGRQSLRPAGAGEGKMAAGPAQDGSHRENHGETATAAATAGTEDNDMVRCVICLDALSEPCVAMPCAHRHFDFLCLASWLLQQQPSCPLCKATVVAVQYGSGLAKTLPVPKPGDGRDADSGAAAAATSAATHPPRASRRRPPRQAPSSAASGPPPETALARRRNVYRLGLYALHVGANRHSRCYQTLTPQLFARDPDLVSRARAFLRRELQVFWPAAAVAPASTEFLIEYIVAILQTVDLQASSGQAEALLRGFFAGGGRDGAGDAVPSPDAAHDDRGNETTRHFLHELRSFLRSPYLTLESWDRHVQYGRKRYYSDDDNDDDNDGDGDCMSSNGDGSGSREAGASTRTRADQWTRPRGDFWRPRGRDRGRDRDRDRDRDRGRNARQSEDGHRRDRQTEGDCDDIAGKRSHRALLAQPLRCRRQHAAALREACRRYDPS